MTKIQKFLNKILRKIGLIRITDRGDSSVFSKTREICTGDIRDMRGSNNPKPTGNIGTGMANKKAPIESASEPLASSIGAACRTVCPGLSTDLSISDLKVESSKLYQDQDNESNKNQKTASKAARAKSSESQMITSGLNTSVVFFGNKNNQGDRDDHQGGKNIKIGHSISNVIHNFYCLMIEILNTQTVAESISPTMASFQSSELFINGSISTEAKSTWPMSRNISETMSYFEESDPMHNQYNQPTACVKISNCLCNLGASLPSAKGEGNFGSGTLAQRAGNVGVGTANQKVISFDMTFRNLTVVRKLGLSPVFSISDVKTPSSMSVDISETVEVGGVEPPRLWVINRVSYHSTPAANIL